jgi:2-methylcitrate dehydratase PrpD
MNDVLNTVSKTGEGATSRLVHHVATLDFAALPSALVTLIKQCVLDTIGVAIGASTLCAEACVVFDYVNGFGGRGDSTILGFGTKAPAPWAAFVNGSLGHMLDYDDMGGAGHDSIATIPAALAVAEKRGGVSGRALIAAIAAGTDLHTRLGRCVRIPDWTVSEGWFATQLFGYISGAATAGRLLGLNQAQLQNAFGIGFNQASGSRQMAVGQATHMRSMQAGFSGQGAVLAAELAQLGLTGPREIFEGRYGMFRTYIRGEPDWSELLGGLGERFALLDVHGFKVWPACSYTRRPNAAIQSLREQFALSPDDIKSITVVGGTGGVRLLCEPLELKRRPPLAIAAKHSIPFTAAVMAVRGTVTLQDYTDAGLHDPAILAMADRVFYRDRPGAVALRGDGPATSAPSVEICTHDGRLLTHTPDGVPGDSRHPASQEELEAKFRDCVSFAAKPIPKEAVERLIVLIRDLDSVEDFGAIMRLVSRAAPKKTRSRGRIVENIR